jgi:hypothetical protein
MRRFACTFTTEVHKKRKRYRDGHVTVCDDRLSLFEEREQGAPSAAAIAQCTSLCTPPHRTAASHVWRCAAAHKHVGFFKLCNIAA